MTVNVPKKGLRVSLRVLHNQSLQNKENQCFLWLLHLFLSRATKALCCSTNAPNGFSFRRTSEDITAVAESQLLPRPWVLSRWNMRGPLPTKMAGLNLAWRGRAGRRGPLYCTFERLTESVHVHLGLLEISQSEQIKSKCPYSLTPTRPRPVCR